MSVRCNFALEMLSALPVTGGDTVASKPGSRGRPSYVRVRTAGCYAAQIDGTTFSRIVTFVVSGPGWFPSAMTSDPLLAVRLRNAR